MVLGLLLRADEFGAYCSVGLTLLLIRVLISASRSESKLCEVFLLRVHTGRISAERAEALELVQRQLAVKTQFLGTVSHELRTPIHGMLGVARLVHVETADPLVKKRMELVEASGTHLLGLVTDLIDVSRIDSGQMRIQRIAYDLWSEVERVADIYSVRAAEKGLAFTLDSHHPADLCRHAEEITCLHQAQLDQRIRPRHCRQARDLGSRIASHRFRNGDTVLDQKQPACVGLKPGGSHGGVARFVDTQHDDGVFVCIEQIRLHEGRMELGQMVSVGQGTNAAGGLQFLGRARDTHLEAEGVLVYFGCLRKRGRVS
jgi:hypothetical protein